MAKRPKKGLIVGASVAIGLTAIVVTANINFNMQMGKVREYISNAEYSKAVEILDEQKGKNSSQEEVYLLYADYYIALGEYQSAVDVLEEGASEAYSDDRINAKIDEIIDLYDVVIMQEEKPSVETSNSTEMPSTENTDSESNIIENINIEEESIFEKIVNSSDLPKYYGSLKEAKKFSKRFEKNIVSTEDYDFKSDITILFIDGYWRNDKIDGIEFYFNNADVSPSFEEAQETMNMFLPFDIIDKYYSEPVQKMYTPNDKNESIYITTCYSLNDSGKGQDGLQGQIGLVYEIKSDICLCANIRFGLPRSLSESNGYFITEYPPVESTNNDEMSITESTATSEPQTSEIEPSASSVPESTQTDSSSIATTPSQSSSTTPSTPKIKPSVVYIAASGNGTKYHRSGSCSGMDGNVIEMTREEAEAAGYSPCKKNSCYG